MAEGNGNGTNGGRKHVNLLTMGEDVAMVTVPGADGSPRDVAVRPISGGALYRVQSADPRERLAAVYDAVGTCVPALSRDEVWALTPAQANGILELACEGLGGDDRPNGNGPGAAPSPPPA